MNVRDTMSKLTSFSSDMRSWSWFTYPNTLMPRRTIRTDRPW